VSEVDRNSRWGRWQVVRPASNDNLGRARSVVRCVCGTEAIVLNHALRSQNTRGCRSVTCRTGWEAAQAANKEPG
jgi:hypothetical protein